MAIDNAATLALRRLHREAVASVEMQRVKTKELRDAAQASADEVTRLAAIAKVYADAILALTVP